MGMFTHVRKSGEWYSEPPCRNPPTTAITSFIQSWIVYGVYTQISLLKMVVTGQLVSRKQRSSGPAFCLQAVLCGPQQAGRNLCTFPEKITIFP